MRILIASLLLAAVASADPSIDDLAKRLGDDDPDVRKAAQAELAQWPDDRVPEIREALLRASDEEVRAALGAELRDRRDRPMRPQAREWMESLTHQAGKGDGELFELDDRAVDLLFAARAEARQCEKPSRGPESWGPEPDPSVTIDAWALALAGMEPDGDAEDAWEWLDGRRGTRLATLIPDGLEARGYQVRDADAFIAARELLRAISESGGVRAADSGKWYYVGLPSRRNASTWLLFQWLPAGITSEAEEWVSANQAFIRWNGNGWVSAATLDDYQALAADGGAATPHIVLRALMAEPGRVAASTWQAFQQDPDPAFRVMAFAGGVVPWKRLGEVLEYAGDSWSIPDLRALWPGEDLTRYLESGEGTARQRRMAAEALARTDPAGAAPFARPWLRASLDGAEGADADLAAAAARILALHDDPADIPDLEHWLASLPPYEPRADVAFALALRGSRAGLGYVIDRAAKGTLPPEFKRRFREKLADRPLTDDRNAWSSWSGRQVGEYRWDAEQGKWKAAK